jgi:hypothetical protein
LVKILINVFAFGFQGPKHKLRSSDGRGVYVLPGFFQEIAAMEVQGPFSDFGQLAQRNT